MLIKLWTKIDKLKTRGGYWGTLNRCVDEDRIEEVFGAGVEIISSEVERIELDNQEDIDVIYE